MEDKTLSLVQEFSVWGWFYHTVYHGQLSSMLTHILFSFLFQLKVLCSKCLPWLDPQNYSPASHHPTPLPLNPTYPQAFQQIHTTLTMYHCSVFYSFHLICNHLDLYCNIMGGLQMWFQPYKYKVDGRSTLIILLWSHIHQNWKHFATTPDHYHHISNFGWYQSIDINPRLWYWYSSETSEIYFPFPVPGTASSSFTPPTGRASYPQIATSWNRDLRCKRQDHSNLEIFTIQGTSASHVYSFLCNSCH